MDCRGKRFLVFIMVFCSFGMVFSLYGQSFKGIIQREKAFISVPASAYQSVEAISKCWGVLESAILAENKAMAGGTWEAQTKVLIPVGEIIKQQHCDSCSPVYHTVAKSEGLYRIGKYYGNVSVATLKSLNHLRSDAIQPGQELLVGYVAHYSTGDVTQTAKSSHEPAAETNPPGTEKPDSVKNNVPVEPKPELLYRGNGFFEPDFQPDAHSILQAEGNAASFKSESGWKDGRFYLLNSQLKTGVVVKVTNLATQKSIYVKVVGPLPRIKQNENLDWRLSNAASASLGVWNEEEVMHLKIEY